MASERFIDDYLGYLLGQANHALYKDFDAHVRAAGLSSIEWRVLATLHDGEPLTVSQLAHEVLSKQPTVTKLVWIEPNAPLANSPMKMSPSSMFMRIMRPVARTTRSGMKFFIVPTTWLKRLPMNRCPRSMIGAP